MKKVKLKFNGILNTYYGNGYVMAREWGTKTASGNNMAGRWVLRSESGDLIDYDKYRNDLAERHRLDLYAESRK